MAGAAVWGHLEDHAHYSVVYMHVQRHWPAHSNAGWRLGSGSPHAGTVGPRPPAVGGSHYSPGDMTLVSNFLKAYSDRALRRVQAVAAALQPYATRPVLPGLCAALMDHVLCNHLDVCYGQHLSVIVACWCAPAPLACSQRAACTRPYPVEAARPAAFVGSHMHVCITVSPSGVSVPCSR